MNQEEQDRVRRNYRMLEEIETLTLEDAVKALKGEEGQLPNLPDTARGQLLKFLQANGFNADLTTIPTVEKIKTDLTATDLAETEETKW